MWKWVMVLLLSGQIGRAVEAWEDNGKTDSPMSVPEGDSPWEISIAWQPAAGAEPADSERLEAIDSLLKDELRRYREMEIRYHSGNADLNDLEDSRSRMILLAIERLLLFPAEAESRKLIAGLRQELYRVQERQLQELELAYQTGAGPLEDIWNLRARQLRLLLEADDRILYDTVAEVPERRRILLTELAEILRKQCESAQNYYQAGHIPLSEVLAVQEQELILQLENPAVLLAGVSDEERQRLGKKLAETIKMQSELLQAEYEAGGRGLAEILLEQDRQLEQKLKHPEAFLGKVSAAECRSATEKWQQEREAVRAEIAELEQYNPAPAGPAD